MQSKDKDNGNNNVSNSGEYRLRLPTTCKQLKPLTAAQMSRINQFSFVPKQTSLTNKMKSSSVITSRLLGTAALNTNRSRFAITSTTLSSMSRMRPYPLIIPTKADANNPIIGSISTRLNFDSDSATTRSLSEQISQSPNKINVSSGEKESKKWESVATSPISQSIDWNAVTKEAELVKYKSKISQLEDKLEESNVKNSRLKIDYDFNVERLSKELCREKDKFIDLEKQLKFNQQKCDDVSSQLTTAREEFAIEYDRYQKKLTEVQKQNSTLAMDINDVKMENESIKVKHESEKIELHHKIETLENELNRFNKEKDILAKHMEEVLALARDSEAVSNEYNKAKLEISRLEDELKSYKDGAKLSEILKDEIQELKKFKEDNIELKRENELLNDVENRNMILKEKLIGLETELKIAQSKFDSSVKMDVDYQNMRSRLNEWQDTLSTSSPCRVSAQIAALQRNEVALREEIGSIKTQLNEMTSSKNQMECLLRSAQSELNEFKKKVNDQSELIKKLNRKCLLFSKEKESYKRLISSYEHDVTIDINKVSQDRIASLETTLDDYKKFIEQLENELKQVKDQTKFNEYESEINELKNEISRLRSINTQMENINKSIADSNESYRVIHYNANPLSQNIEEDVENYKKLIEENRKLTAKIEILESGNDQNMSRKIEEGLKSAIEVEKLKQKLSSAEKRQQSIIDAFKKTSKDFREVCYILTGYRIDALKQNIYRLSHVYADSPNENLLFEWEADRTIKLLENSYSEKLTDLLHTYLKQHDSFPAFLASLTLDLFRKQTHVANVTQSTF